MNQREEVVSITDLRSLEREYAGKYWDNMPLWEDLGHLVYHNTKMLGMLSSLCEVGQHCKRGDMKQPILTEALKRRMVANYLIWALHYANEWKLNLLDCFIEKQESNVRRAEAEGKF